MLDRAPQAFEIAQNGDEDCACIEQLHVAIFWRLND
jgi:hypothetical protein